MIKIENFSKRYIFEFQNSKVQLENFFSLSPLSLSLSFSSLPLKLTLRSATIHHCRPSLGQCKATLPLPEPSTARRIPFFDHKPQTREGLTIIVLTTLSWLEVETVKNHPKQTLKQTLSGPCMAILTVVETYLNP